MPNFSIPLSGLTAESTALSTIANNLANQNTTGYKNKVVLFTDLFYQNLGTSGAGDPIQQGAGTQVGSTPSLFTQGSVSSTGVPTDVAIQGSGFYAVQDASGVISYTRSGAFSELNNYLVTSSGQQVLGYPAVNGVIDPGAGLVPLQLGAGLISPPTVTSNVKLTTNLDAAATSGSAPFSTPITVYVAPGGLHMRVQPRRTGSRFPIVLDQRPDDLPHIPSINVLMKSVAEVFGSHAVGVIMTGMGSDGAEGMKAIYEEGGVTIGQDQESCVIYGMPRVCAEIGVLNSVVPLSQMARRLLQITGYRRRALS